MWRKGSVTEAVDQILELSALKYGHLWIRMLWSWWPCVSIMTSASSSTNTRIFLGSKNLNFPHQSSIVPGVPITICSWSFVPLGTEIFRRNKESLLKLQLKWENATINKAFEEKPYIYFLWRRTLNSPQNSIVPSALSPSQFEVPVHTWVTHTGTKKHQMAI